MKKYFIAFLVIISLSSFIICKSDRGINKLASPPTATLDSLQGTWVSSKDTLSEMIISHDTIYNIYNGEPIDTSNFYIADSCRNPLVTSYDKNKINGSYIIIHNSGYSIYSIAFKISYLSANALELVTDNKYLGFDKK